MKPKRRSKSSSNSTSATDHHKAKRPKPSNDTIFFQLLKKAGLSFQSDGCRLAHEGTAFQQKLSKLLTSEEVISDFVTSLEESLEEEQLFLCSLLPTEVGISDDLFPASTNQVQVIYI